MRKFDDFLKLVLVIVLFIFIGIGCEKEEKNTPPQASFTINPETDIMGSSFTFDASGCNDEQDMPATLLVRWDWESDGIFDTDFSTNKILIHQYLFPGTVQITLEVKDSKELGASLTKSLVILGKVAEVSTGSVSAITFSSATCEGNVTSDNSSAVTDRGICWNTSGSPTLADNHTSSGSGMGAFFCELTGLSDQTIYYYCAFATNDAGTSYGEEKSFTTKKNWSCGDPIEVGHIAGNVAPVNKTIIYGTVNNIAGEPEKCWITRNLGADQQAFAASDATEVSAGWYWQFNRMQGFKHDGSTRTPNTTWVTPISENSDWLDENDPCSIEIGNGWRLPTHVELSNLIYGGNWVDWSGPWSSGLKLHAAGALHNANGSLFNRGTSGGYWSVKQYDASGSYYMALSSSVCIIYYDGAHKSYGLSIRCIQD